MTRDTLKFSKGLYDLLVVGGGINGAAVSHLAAKSGLRVCLIEKGDFASGTSTKTTKLVHGGIRYLENFEFELVEESLRERHTQLRAAPHLVRPLSFVVPVYKDDRRPLWMMKLGVFLYDLFSGKYVIKKHCSLTVQEVIQHVPDIKKEGLLGGVMYSDAQMDDARLCLENVLCAVDHDAHVANYVEAVEFLKEGGKVIGVKARDLQTGDDFEIKAKHTVCTLGPWTNIFLNQINKNSRHRVRPTKGVHIVYKGEFSKEAILITAKEDKRIFFIIPWKGNSLIGTTDTDYDESIDHVDVKQSDIDYLFDEAKKVFPNREFKDTNIITTFAGLRPLVHKAGAPSRVSRSHVIFQAYNGAVFVMGGKYTTYRKIAEDCLKKLKINNIPTEKEFSLYRGQPIDDNNGELAEQYGVDKGVIEYLKTIYGIRYKEVLSLVKDNPDLKKTLCSCSPTIAAQVVYAVETELAQTAEDIIERRLALQYLPCEEQRCRRKIGEMLAPSS